jgi:hypothetical protein
MKTRRSFIRHLRAVWWMYRPTTEDMLCLAASAGIVTVLVIVAGGL